MLRAWHLGVAVAVLAMVAAPAFSQQQGGGRGGRRGGGFFGGGMGGGFGSVQMLALEQVQKELELSDDQKAELTKLGEELRAEFQQGTGSREDFQKLSQEERQKRFDEMRTRMEASTKKAQARIDEILLPPQAARLKQINLQIQGAGALNNPEVVEALGITEEQQQQFTAIREDLQAKFAALRPARGTNQGAQGTQGEQGNQEGQATLGNSEERRASFTKLMQESTERTMAVLTEEQKAKFEEMKGPKFEIDMSQFRGAGGGARRRGGNGQQTPEANPAQP